MVPCQPYRSRLVADLKSFRSCHGRANRKPVAMAGDMDRRTNVASMAMTEANGYFRKSFEELLGNPHFKMSFVAAAKADKAGPGWFVGWLAQPNPA